MSVVYLASPYAAVFNLSSAAQLTDSSNRYNSIFYSLYNRILMMMTMKSGPSGLFLLLLLTSSASGLGSVVWIGYKYYGVPYTWQNAQSFCRRWASYSHYHQ